MAHKMKKKTKKSIGMLILVAAVVILSGIVFLPLLFGGEEQPQPEIISKSSLEKILNVSDLSTFEAVYNGVATVMNEENTEVDYYVSYEAKVKAGIDFKKVDISIDHEKKTVTVQMPTIGITDVTVDITTLDYIFQNKDRNESSVSAEAYKKCIEDVTNESSTEDAIFELAEENARNIVEALIRPFIEQLDEAYQLNIV